MACGIRSAIGLCMLIVSVATIPLEDFYSFGSEHGDDVLSANDDGSTEEIQLSVSFPFFDRDHNSLFVNNNGDISFTRQLGVFTPLPFPLSDSNVDLQIIAPYWADVDTSASDTVREPGSVWYRETTDPELLERAQKSVRSSFINHKTFVPTYLFIATWDQVGYYSSHTDKINTFQCVMATDGVSSFVIFLYADGGIQWTTGDASDGTNGFGGTPAQVGFNAGDGVHFASVPGSQTPEIVNISTTSNVGIPGVWIFWVDQEEVQYGGCSDEDDVELIISPRYGPLLGGQTVKVQGPCFEDFRNIECIFGDIEVRGIYIREDLVICVSPMLILPERVEFALKSDRRVFYGPIYTTLEHFRGHSVDIITDTMVFTKQSRAVIQWTPETVFSLPPDTGIEIDYFVTISLYQLSVNTAQWKEVHVFVTETVNDGEEEIVFPDTLSRDGTAVTSPIVVFISVTPSDTNFIQEKLKLYDLRPGIWSAEFYFAESSAFQPYREGLTLCDVWYLSEPDNIGTEILNSVDPCPPTQQQASQLCNSGVIVERYFSLYGNVRYNEQRMNFFHPDATICYKQPIVNEIETGGRGQHCCYDKSGNLITGPPSGGTVDKWSEVIDPAKHFQDDVQPFLLCCKGELPHCDKYYKRRPSDDGSRFNPRPCSWMMGDPHFVTLDGLQYTFNGHGEFTLLQTTNSSELVVQGRMVSTEGNGTGLVHATVFSAIVAKQENSDIVQFEISRRGLDALINGKRVQFDDNLNEQQFENVTINDLSNSTLSAAFTSGVSITVQEENGILSIIKIVLPDSYKSTVEGLLGNYNGDSSDDLRPKSEMKPLPVNSTSQVLHHNFGITWIINTESDSLFTYNTGKVWSDFYLPDFEAIFLTNVVSILADEVCGDDPFCRFDIIVTGRTDIATSTLEGSTNVELVSNLSLPIICNPPCVQGVCVANDTCSCSAGYAGIICNETVYSDCPKSPCLNGGNCVNHAGTYTCMCPPEFTGSICEIAMDSNNNAQRNIIPIATGAGALLFFVGAVCLITLTCCVVHKRRNSLIQNNDNHLIDVLEEIKDQPMQTPTTNVHKM